MSLEYFQFLANEPFDKSIIKRDFSKLYHQQGANLSDPDQNVEFIFGGNNNYHQIGKSYLDFDIAKRNLIAKFDNDSAIRLTNTGLDYVFKEGRLSTTSGSDLEHNNFVGQVSTNMRSRTSKDGNLLSQYDIIIEEIGEDNDATSDKIRSISLNNMLINNHKEANRGRIKVIYHWNIFLDFVKLLKG